MNEIYERAGIGVRVYLETWDKPTLEQFYAACHALVYPSHGEGKNLPALEFAATGGVELVTDWSGHRSGCGRTMLTRWPAPWAQCSRASRSSAHWAVVDIPEIKRAMWHVFTHRAEAKAKGELAARLIPQMCSWDMVVEALFRRLRDLVPGQGEMVQSLARPAAGIRLKGCPWFHRAGFLPGSAPLEPEPELELRCPEPWGLCTAGRLLAKLRLPGGGPAMSTRTT